MKVAGLCSAQVSRLAQKRDGQLLDQSLLQQETCRNLAASITTVIGICAPAADALRAKVSHHDSRFADFTSVEDTGILESEAHLLAIFSPLTTITVSSLCIPKLLKNILLTPTAFRRRS